MTNGTLRSRRFLRGPTVLLWVCVGCALPLACKRDAPPEDRGQAPEPPAPVEAPPPAPPWFEGTWHGDIELQAAAPQEGAGLPKEWKDDPGGGLGPAKLSLSIDGERRVTGTLVGALRLEVQGLLEDTTLRAQLHPTQPDEATATASFRGTLVAAPEGTVHPAQPPPEPPPNLVGTLRLSSGDSLRIRHARVSLERTSPQRKTAPPPSP